MMPIDATPDEDVLRRRASLERRLVCKLDTILLPFLSLLFLLNSLDRSNIGNAETANFTRDAGLDPEDLGISMAWFFGFFVALQPIGAAVGRRVGMGRWVPSVMSLWGFCTILHAWVSKRWQLITLRITIGILEAGFYPITVSYLSLFYTRYEFARRLSLFYGQYAIAGAIGGILAFVIFSRFTPGDDVEPQTNSLGSMKPWQYLFLIEGVLTIAVATVGYMWLPRRPGSAWFLNMKERELAEERIRIDRMGAGEGLSEETSETSLPNEQEVALDGLSPDEEQTRALLSSTDPSLLHPQTKDDVTSDAGLSKSDILSAVLFLPLIIPILFLNVASALPGTAFSIFLPLVLDSMKLSSPLYANLLTAPPFFIAAVTLYLFAYWSDRSHQRILPILVGLGLIIVGLIVTLALQQFLSPSWAMSQYIGVCVLLSGSFIPSPLTVAWLSGNIAEPGKRAIIMGINGWGNLAGVLASLLFAPRWREDGYRFPLLITLIIAALSFVGFLVLRFALARLNAARNLTLDRWPQAEAEQEGRSKQAKDMLEAYLTEGVPAFALVGGIQWDVKVRYWVGQKLLKMDPQECYVRRGDERFTFQFGL